MSDDQTPRLQLPYLAAAQAQKHVTLNEALGRLDALVACRALSRTVTAPPASPDDGDLYIAPPSGLTGAWSTAPEGALLRWADGVWSIEPAPEGLVALVVDEGRLWLRDASGWTPLGDRLGEAQSLTRLGIGTTADANAPLAAKLNAALLTARSLGEGGSGDLRLTLNKSAAAGVASMLLQDGYSGRAEIGLTGDDDLSVKVSADGATWTTALRVAHDTGAVSLPAQPLAVGQGGTGARSAAAGCAALGALPLAGGAMTGVIITKADGGLTCPAGPDPYPAPGVTILESDHATSNRAGLAIGANWFIGQDFAASGPRDLFFYSQALLTSQLLLPETGGVSVQGVPVFDPGAVLCLKPVAAADLPGPSPAGRALWCYDAGAVLVSDGGAWRRHSGGVLLVTGDADRSVGALDAPVQVQTGALTATRHLTLPVGAAWGAVFRFVRTGGGAGALDVGGLKTVADQSWCEVVYDGGGWRLIGAGTL